MGAELGVSASYITLIEANQRPASAKLLMKLAEVYDLNISELSPSVDAQLAADFGAAVKDPVLDLATLPRAEVEAVLQASPRLAAAFVRLHERHHESVLRPDDEDSPLADRDKVEVLAETPGWVHYDLPPELLGRMWKGQFCGQRQKWVLMRFLGEDADIRIDTDHPEFQEWRWMPPTALLENIVPFKRGVYEEVLAAFQGWLR